MADESTEPTGDEQEDGEQENPEEEQDLNPDDIEPEVRLKEDKPDGDKPDENEEVDPEDKKTIEKVVDSRLKSATKGLDSMRDQVEVDAFLRSKPEMGRYRDVALKYMAHPAYKNIPVHNIMAMVSAKDQQKLGAEKEREAAQKAEASKNPGSGARKQGGGAVDWGRASKDEVSAKMAEVLGRQGQ